MRNALILFAVLLLSAALSMPASAYYLIWADGFESYTVGSPPGDGWFTPTGRTQTVVVNNPVDTGEKAVQQLAGGASVSAVNLRSLNWNNELYDTGYAKFRMYDPGDVGDPVVQTDGRVGIYCDKVYGPESASAGFTAHVQTNNPSLHWEAQWSWSPVMMDGVAAPTSTGYTFTAGAAAPRVTGWNTVWILWSFDNVNQTGHIEWRINNPAVTNLILDFDSNTARWAASNNIAGMLIGSNYSNITPCTFDNVEFYGGVPEPTSLLVLGTGLVGLAGLVRRRR